jgi:hypothetical protein
VRLLDLNILLYAVNRDSPRHERARRWVEASFAGVDGVALAWVVILGFLRLTTSRQVFPNPLDPQAALSVVDGWLARPNVVAIHAGPEHWRILRSLLADTGTAGNLTTDAHLAALAIEHGCELSSTDADFGRFHRVKWVDPLADRG